MLNQEAQYIIVTLFIFTTISQAMRSKPGESTIAGLKKYISKLLNEIITHFICISCIRFLFKLEQFHSNYEKLYLYPFLKKTDRFVLVIRPKIPSFS